MRGRLLVSAVIGLMAGILCTAWMKHFHQGAADFNWAIWMAQDLLAGHNPYLRPMQLYPIPAAFFGLPFVGMRLENSAGAFYGISSALMAFGLSRHGYHRLLAFLAYPYWAGLITAQWTPLLVAAAMFPALLPATLAKPQIGIPVLLTRVSRKGLVACAVVLALSFLILPGWPRLWAGNWREYARFVPLLVFPGPLLALALLRYRERDAHLLLLMAMVPQRWFYDGLILWLIPKSRRELYLTVLISWTAGIWRWYHIPQSFTQVGRCMVLAFYLPMLVLLLARGRSESPAGESGRFLP